MGNRSLKTRSSPMSSRSFDAASNWSSDSKARVWMSRRWGISIPWSSLANEICFIKSGMNHLQAQIALPPSSAKFSRVRSRASFLLQLWCYGVKSRSYRRSESNGAGERRGGSAVCVRNAVLLHFDGCSLLLELGFHRCGLILVDAGLHIRRRSIDEILRFLETQAGQLAHDLDDLNLLRTSLLEHDLELGLLFHRGSGSCTSTATGRSGSDRRSRDRDVELALESFDELGQLEHRHVADRVENVFFAHSCVCHCCCSPGDFFRRLRAVT